MIIKGYRFFKSLGKNVAEHRRIAEDAIGRPLKGTEQVHHWDENTLNNHPSNLVICPDMAYHKLLHKRQRALAESGNANYLMCRHCKKYDDQRNLVVIECKGKLTTRIRAYHKTCNAIAAKARNRSAAVG